MTQEQMQAMMDELINGAIKRDGIGKTEGSAILEDLRAEREKLRRLMDEDRVRNQPRQMMGWEDVVAALGVSRSTAYSIIRKLNQELANNNYITVRGKVSRAYFEKRVFGVSADVG